MSKLQKKFMKCLITMIFIILISTLIAHGTTSHDEIKNKEKDFHIIMKRTVEVILAVILVIAIIWKSVSKSGHPKLIKQPTPPEFKDSYFYEPMSESIIENLQSMSRERCYLALMQIANCPVYNEEIIIEMAKIISRQPPYNQVTWLNSVYRCRLCRFLHLAIERNRASEIGERFDDGIDFNSIFYASNNSYCVIHGTSDSFIGSLIREIRKVIIREDGNS